MIALSPPPSLQKKLVPCPVPRSWVSANTYWLKKMLSNVIICCVRVCVGETP